MNRTFSGTLKIQSKMKCDFSKESIDKVRWLASKTVVNSKSNKSHTKSHIHPI